ncbi:MAG: hypothetical protein WB424_02080 [Terracidiphilus sp.]
MMLERHLAVVFLAALVSALHPGASAQVHPTLVGILEDNPGHYAGNPHYRDVRVVFRKEGTRWFAFPNNCPDQDCLKTIAAKFPTQVNWTISFDGKQVGQVESRTPPSFDFYATVGQQVIVGTSDVPTVGKPSADFSGFQDEPVLRPLVAVSKPNYSDPEHWKPARPTPEIIAAVRQSYLSRFPKIANCIARTTGRENSRTASLGEAISVQKLYGSNRNWFLVEAQSRYCDGGAISEFSSRWFVINPERQVKYLGSSMWLVDAGDYDNDGKSEVVFSIDDYDRGGYKLFYDDFSRSAIFEFGYH